MNRVVRENDEQGVNFVVSDSYSSLSQRDAGLYADERVKSVIDQREAWRQVKQIIEDNLEAFIHYFP